jgi:hypothetical protein
MGKEPMYLIPSGGLDPTRYVYCGECFYKLLKRLGLYDNRNLDYQNLFTYLPDDYLKEARC